MNLMSSRRITCVAGVIAFSCVFYGAYSIFMLNRLESFAAKLGPLDLNQPLHEDVDRILPAMEIALVGSVLPLAFLLYAAHWWIRALYRRSHNGCPDCGGTLTSWRGRCLHCHVRIGPDLPRGAYTIRV